MVEADHATDDTAKGVLEVVHARNYTESAPRGLTRRARPWTPRRAHPDPGWTLSARVAARPP